MLTEKDSPLGLYGHHPTAQIAMLRSWRAGHVAQHCSQPWQIRRCATYGNTKVCGQLPKSILLLWVSLGVFSWVLP